MNSPAPITPTATVPAIPQPILTLPIMSSLNDDRSDHARMYRAGKVIGAGLVEFERETFVRIHATRLEHSGVADHRVRFIVHVGPSHGRACFDRHGGGFEHEVFDN